MSHQQATLEGKITPECYGPTCLLKLEVIVCVFLTCGCMRYVSLISVQEAGLCAAQTAEHQTQQDVVQQWHNVPSTAQRLSYYAQAGCSAKGKGFSTPKLYAKRALLNLKPSVYGETVRDADSHFRWCHSQTQYKKFCYVAL